MIPPEPPGRGPGRKAERALWNALRSLPDDVFVYYGLHYLEGQRAKEGEVDFLVLHREKGMLVVECKGDGVRRTGTGTWVRGSRDGTEHAIENPFAQAQRQVKDLVRELTARMANVLPGPLPLVHGHAVAFPLAELREGKLPLEAQRANVLFAEDLATITMWVDRAFAFWRRAANVAPTPLDATDFRRFRRNVLHPQLDIVETLRARLHADDAALARLTAEQVKILRGCAAGRRVRVPGAAGTGKTVLALETARRYADAPGSRVLLACFNRPLAQHLARVVEGWGPRPGTVDVTTFHALCRRAFEALGRPYEPPSERDRAAADLFWDVTAPATLREAVASGAVPRFDAIVVDEAQDFHADWAAALESCLLDKATGRLAIFYDAAQRLFDRESGLEDLPPSFALSVNFRNTRAIAAVVRALGRVDVEPHDDCPEGDAPVVHVDEGAAQTRLQVEEVVTKLLGPDGLAPDAITILTPHKPEHSSLAGLEHLGGAAVSHDPNERAGKVLHTTIGRFKGLEADVILLVDIDPSDPRCDRAARYVAASRARHVLHVWARGDWSV